MEETDEAIGFFSVWIYGPDMLYRPFGPPEWTVLKQEGKAG